MSDDATQAATSIIKALEAAWNAGDGEAFGSAFAEDAYFVDIRGEHHEGRMPIVKGHQAIMDTIYKGSTVQYQLLRARVLAPGVVGAQVASTMHAPSGPLAARRAKRVAHAARRRK